MRKTSDELLAGGYGFPFIEEGEDIFGGHGAGRFEFAVLLAEEQLAIGIEYGDGGDAAVERDIIFFGNVEIFVHLADVDVNDEVGFVEGGSDFGTVEGFVEDVAIEAPVAAKDDENAFVRSGGGAQGFSDFLASVSAGGVEIFLCGRRMEERGCGSLRNTEEPQIIQMEPTLSHGDVLLFEGGTIFGGESEMEDQDVQSGLGVLLFDDFPGEIGEAVGFQA